MFLPFVVTSARPRHHWQCGLSFNAIPYPQSSSTIYTTKLIHCTPVSNGSEGAAAWSSSFGTILQKISVQRAQLQSLNHGADHLAEDVEALDETLEVENEVKGELVEDAHEAMGGWEGTWFKYDRCEPVEVLQQRPNQVIDLVRDMDWHIKKAFFQMLIQGVRGREAYLLQQLITGYHGDLQGFDIFNEMSEQLSDRIMRQLRFVDLASCRLVCKGWYKRVMTYGTLRYAIDRFTQIHEVMNIAREHPLRSNWNKLCRLYQREMSWRKGKPVRIDELNGHTNYVTSIKDRAGWIVSGGYDEVVCLWEAATGNCSRIWHLGSAVSCVELHVDKRMEGGGVIVAAFVDVGVVKIWPIHGTQCMHTLIGHQKGVRALAMNERFLVTAGFDQTILNVHLVGTTVYSLCIDATLRVYDIPSRTLLNQVKLFEVQPGSTLQWSCLRDGTLFAATNKKVYIWKMENLESPFDPHSKGSQRKRTRPRSKSNMSQASDNSLSPYDDDHHSPPYSPTGSTGYSTADMSSRPTTPAVATVVHSNVPRDGSSYFYSASNASSSTCSLIEGVDSVETRVKPSLMTVLNMTTDMWCGELTRHEPPLLILGSRSSAIKLVAVVITKEMLDPPAYKGSSEYVPRQLYPKSIPVQGLPSSQGKGVMCVESDADKLVVGCTGGSIHVVHMDPACVASTLRTTPTILAPTTLHPSAHDTQDSSTKGLTVITSSLPQQSGGATLSPSSAGSNGHPRKLAAAVYRTNSSSIVPKFALPSPDHSPLLSNGSSTFTASLESPVQNHQPRPSISSGTTVTSTFSALATSVPISSPEAGNRGGWRRQSSLPGASVTTGSPQGLPFDDYGVISSNRSSVYSTTRPAVVITTSPFLSSSQRKKSASSDGQALSTPLSKSASKKKKPFSSATSTSTSTPSSNGNSSAGMSAFSKYIPSPPSRIVLRRRATSAAWVHEHKQQQQQQQQPQRPTSPPVDSFSSAPSLAAAGESSTGAKLKSRTDPSRLATVVSKRVSHRFSMDGSRLFGSNDSSSENQLTGLGLSKGGWSLSSPWQSPRRQTEKNKN
ncbi:hypothetical protein DFQ27_002439 [Actinomortierella ambigua]|uniref:F-box domain-containing protein n=1 Tax=Actinomortierella ambigua TaxID=1343610 RepID=A0A9P6Q7G6_9FUNG|nr:hypothetical protein DFQ27_002439 [Actinomortierella ambigua]